MRRLNSYTMINYQWFKICSNKNKASRCLTQPTHNTPFKSKRGNSQWYAANSSESNPIFGTFLIYAPVGSIEQIEHAQIRQKKPYRAPRATRGRIHSVSPSRPCPRQRHAFIQPAPGNGADEIYASVFCRLFIFLCLRLAPRRPPAGNTAWVISNLSPAYLKLNSRVECTHTHRGPVRITSEQQTRSPLPTQRRK